MTQTCETTHADRDGGRDAPAQSFGVGCGGEEIVERAALVGLGVREAEVADFLNRMGETVESRRVAYGHLGQNERA